VHSNGLGQNFADCVALGTMNAAQAHAAAVAFSPGTIIFDVPSCPNGSSAQCNQTATQCACWGYAGPGRGRVLLVNSTGCLCPGATSTAWD
jgi:hypothetical protein